MCRDSEQIVAVLWHRGAASPASAGKVQNLILRAPSPLWQLQKRTKTIEKCATWLHRQRKSSVFQCLINAFEHFLAPRPAVSGIEGTRAIRFEHPPPDDSRARTTVVPQWF